MIIKMVRLNYMNDQISYAIENIKTSKKELILQILIVFILPVIAIRANLIEGDDRIWILAIIVSVLVGILIKEKWTRAMLGVTNYRIRKYIIPYIIFTLSAVILISLFGEKLGQEEVAQWWKHSHFIYGFFVVSLFQEIDNIHMRQAISFEKQNRKRSQRRGRDCLRRN